MATIEKDLLADVKNYIDRTYSDEEADRKLEGIIQRGMLRLNDIAGCEQDYSKEGLPRALLFDYVRYVSNNASESFEDNFRSELLTLMLESEVEHEITQRRC